MDEKEVLTAQVNDDGQVHVADYRVDPVPSLQLRPLDERRAIILRGAKHKQFSLKDIYDKVNGHVSSCSLECFEVCWCLKSLGYIVRGHGVPLTVEGEEDSISIDDSTSASNDSSVHALAIVLASLNVFEDLSAHNLGLVNDLKPDFDVYVPSGEIKKSSPANPSFMLYIRCKDPPFLKSDFECMERKCNGVPFKICHVDLGRPSFFTLNRTQLPNLP